MSSEHNIFGRSVAVSYLDFNGNKKDEYLSLIFVVQRHRSSPECVCICVPLSNETQNRRDENNMRDGM